MELLPRLGIEHPVILAPMAGGPGTPELVAAVSNGGGLGSFGAAYLSPDELRAAIRRIRALTARPFSVNLFAGGHSEQTEVDAGRMLEILAGIHAALGLPVPELPATPPNRFDEQLEVVLDERPAAFSFTFGIPSADALMRLRFRGIAVLGTATTVEEGRILAAAGVDAIVVQGAEAGGHRGTFAVSFEDAMVPVRELVEAVAPIAPVIASGGIMDGRQLARLMRAGAAAGQLGTAFLTCPESGASPAHKDAILKASGDPTVITRAFSGRPARGIDNAFARMLAGKEDVILPFPLQHGLTRGMRTAAAKQGRADLLALWAGQGCALARPMPAADLVRTLVEEAKT